MKTLIKPEPTGLGAPRDKREERKKIPPLMGRGVGGRLDLASFCGGTDNGGEEDAYLFRREARMGGDSGAGWFCPLTRSGQSYLKVLGDLQSFLAKGETGSVVRRCGTQKKISLRRVGLRTARRREGYSTRGNFKTGLGA